MSSLGNVHLSKFAGWATCPMRRVAVDALIQSFDNKVSLLIVDYVFHCFQTLPAPNLDLLAFGLRKSGLV